MEDLRRDENRKGRPHNLPGRMARKDNTQAPKGFEGMNFEQKRKPYNETNRLNKDWDRHSDNDSEGGRRREDS